MEKWNLIDEFPNYQVSDKGRVKNTKTGRVLKLQHNSRGYAVVTLHDEDGQRCKRVYRLVAESFCEGRKPGLDVNHIDGDKNKIFKPREKNIPFYEERGKKSIFRKNLDTLFCVFKNHERESEQCLKTDLKQN